MNPKSYYLSLQYSAIQKTVLRHDRLWSMSGISQIMAGLNEIIMPGLFTTGLSELVSGLNETIIKEIQSHKGTLEVLISGGGKFTAKFSDKDDAIAAKKAIRAIISTTLPMLEFQISEVVEAENLIEATDKKTIKVEKEGDERPYPGLVHELDEQKRCFRGYGLTYNPHMKVCEECGEYPATGKPIKVKTGIDKYGKQDLKETFFCAVCRSAKVKADIKLASIDGKKEHTTMGTIYKRFVGTLEDKSDLKIPMNFDDLYPDDDKAEQKGKQKKRMAVWASDINGMGDKLTVWLNQEDEEIKKIFDIVKEINIKAVSEALINTFRNKEKDFVEKTGDDEKVHRYIPFRLIVAGGDDLCVVMKDTDIIEFAIQLSECLNKSISSKTMEDNNKYLSIEWLTKKYNENPRKNNDGKKVDITFRPHSFGGSFVVTPLHTPFKKIHHVAEELMSTAKKKTCRMRNSVNWMVMSADEEPVSGEILEFEKPLYIDEIPDFESESCSKDSDKPNAAGYLTFREYIKMASEYRKKKLSNSHIQQIITKIINFGTNSDDTPEKLEKWLKRLPDAAKKDSAIKNLLRDNRLRTGENGLDCKRITTLFELMSI